MNIRQIRKLAHIINITACVTAISVLIILQSVELI